METLQACPVCQHTHLNPCLTCQDYTVSQEKFSIQTCHTCGFTFTNPRPEPAAIGKYYQSPDYISHSDTDRGLVNKVYRWVRNITLQSKLRLITGLLPEMPEHQKRLLDIGCGTGMFLKVCKQAGWQVTGTEPDEETRHRAIKNSEAPIFEDFMQLNDNQTFDVITMWHVLEHIHELDACVQQLKKLLTEKGVLLVAVPNHHSHDATVYQQYWAAYDVPRHLSHFSQQDIARLFEKNGMKLASTKPLWFDAFYISLLSSKYKTGKINYVQALWQGLVSNLKALRNNQFSSLIYIIKK